MVLVIIRSSSAGIAAVVQPVKLAPPVTFVVQTVKFVVLTVMRMAATDVVLQVVIVYVMVQQ